jgi:O-glycosyl hydrolase
MRTCILQSLFSPTLGAGISLIRISIGGSDFASSVPSTDETSSGHFSLSSDDKDVIDVLKIAKQINPKIEVIATPWTAPTWMKTPSGNPVGGTLDSADDAAYSAYFVDFIKAYEADGITINYVTPQNEPGDSTNDPSMVMSESNEAIFVDQYLSPALRALSTEILIYDWNWDAQNGTCADASECWSESEIKSLLSGAPSNVVGVGWHCYSYNSTDDGTAVSQSLFQGSLGGADPLQIMDECSGHGPNYPIGENLKWDSQNLVISSLNNFGSGIQFWNLALPTYPYTPPSGSCKSTPKANNYCRGVLTVNSPTSVDFNVEYYILKALADSIEAGSTHIQSGPSNSSSSVVSSTAASNLNGTRGLYVEVNSAVSSLTVVEGNYEFRYLGDLPADSVISFRWLPAKLSNVESLASSVDGYCTVLSTGKLDCWGYNLDGSLGNGTTAFPDNGYGYDTAQPVTGITNATAVASDNEGYCAVLSSGGIDCWGYNLFGEVGNGATGGPDSDYGYDAPQTVTGITDAIAVTSDGYGGGYCAILSSGGVDCWGDNSDGELGNGTTGGPDGESGYDTPQAVTGISDATSVVTDEAGYCAVLSTGRVDCWGDNSDGELGKGTTGGPDGESGYDTPQAVTGITDAKAVVSDEVGYCAVLSTGGIDCWGDDSDGELGNGIVGSYDNTPQAVSGITNAVTLAGELGEGGGETGYCALLSTGGVDCWGGNFWGALGNGTTGGPDGEYGYDTPQEVIGISDAVAVDSDDSSGGYCVLLSSRGFDCWGDNTDGEIGNGSFSGPDGADGYDTPKAVTGVTDGLALGSAYESHCAVLASGGVDCWGDNATDELGNGTFNGPDNEFGYDTPQAVLAS